MVEIGELVWIMNGGEHRAIVLDVYSDGRIALLVPGTSTKRPSTVEWDHVSIDPTSVDGTNFTLTKVTYFYKRNIAEEYTNALTSTGLCCGIDKLLEFRDLAEQWELEKDEENRLRGFHAIAEADKEPQRD